MSFLKNLNVHDYLLFPRLKKNNLFNLYLISKENKDLEFLSTNYCFKVDLKLQNFLITSEKRFWIYEKSLNIKKKNYLFCFQKYDFESKSFAFSNRIESCQSKVSQKNFYNNFRFFLRKVRSKSREFVVFKGRSFSLMKRGYLIRCYGKKFFIKKRLKTRRFFSHNKRLKIKRWKKMRYKLRLGLKTKFFPPIPYKSWFLQSIESYGVLTHFYLRLFNLKKQRKKQLPFTSLKKKSLFSSIKFNSFNKNILWKLVEKKYERSLLDEALRLWKIEERKKQRKIKRTKLTFNKSFKNKNKNKNKRINK